MLLVIRDSRSAIARLLSGDKVAQQLGIESAAIDVADSQQLIAVFPKTVKFINDHLISEYRKHMSDGHQQENSGRSTWGKVLVFCESGNERSAAVVAAYLMHMYGLDLVNALQYIQTQRFCVAFDDNMKNLLLNYQDILNAQRSVAESPTPPQIPLEATSGPSQLKAKRGREVVDLADGDMDLDDADDEERFGGRTTFAPFRDSPPEYLE